MEKQVGEVTQTSIIHNDRSFINMEKFKQMQEIANIYIKSDALPKTIKNHAQLVMILQAGNDLGLNISQSISGLYIINGLITVYGTIAIMLIKRGGYKIEWIESTAKRAEVKVSKGGEECIETYTIAEADYAGLLNGGMGIWRKYPRQMLRYKVLGFVRKFFCPEVMSGMQMETEMDDIQDGEIETINKVDNGIEKLKQKINDVKNIEELMDLKGEIQELNNKDIIPFLAKRKVELEYGDSKDVTVEILPNKKEDEK